MSSPRPRTRLSTTSGPPPARGDELSGEGEGPVEPPSTGTTSTADLLTTGDMARMTATTLRTVRFYEEAGILHPARRSEGGHRLFARGELDRLRLVSDMREAGLSLDDIRSLLALKQRASSGGDAARAAGTALREVLTSLKAKLEVLTRLSDDLDRTLRHAEACAGCEGTDLFPHRCGECNKLLVKGPVPRGLRVLWGMPDGSTAEAPDGAAEDARIAGSTAAPGACPSARPGA